MTTDAPPGKTGTQTTESDSVIIKALWITGILVSFPVTVLLYRRRGIRLWIAIVILVGIAGVRYAQASDKLEREIRDYQTALQKTKADNVEAERANAAAKRAWVPYQVALVGKAKPGRDTPWVYDVRFIGDAPSDPNGYYVDNVSGISLEAKTGALVKTIWINERAGTFYQSEPSHLWNRDQYVLPERREYVRTSVIADVFFPFYFAYFTMDYLGWCGNMAAQAREQRKRLHDARLQTT